MQSVAVTVHAGQPGDSLRLATVAGVGEGGQAAVLTWAARTGAADAAGARGASLQGLGARGSLGSRWRVCARPLCRRELGPAASTPETTARCRHTPPGCCCCFCCTHGPGVGPGRPVSVRLPLAASGDSLSCSNRGFQVQPHSMQSRSAQQLLLKVQ